LEYILKYMTMEIYQLKPEQATGTYRNWMLAYPELAILGQKPLDATTNSYLYMMITPKGEREWIGSEEMQIIIQHYQKLSL